MVGAPELVVERQELPGDFLAVLVKDLHVLDAALASHRSGEFDVHPQQILGDDVAGGIDVRDDRCRFRVRCGSADRRDKRRGA